MQPGKAMTVKEMEPVRPRAYRLFSFLPALLFDPTCSEAAIMRLDPALDDSLRPHAEAALRSVVRGLRCRRRGLFRHVTTEGNRFIERFTARGGIGFSVEEVDRVFPRLARDDDPEGTQFSSGDLEW